MTDAMKKSEVYSFSSFFGRMLRLVRSEMLVFWCIQVGLWLIVTAVMAVVEAILGMDTRTVDLPGLFAFLGGIIAAFCLSMTLTSTFYSLMVGYGTPRRRVVAGIWMLGVLYGIAMVLVTLGLHVLWKLMFGAGREVLDMVSMIPWWGLAAAALLPVAVSVFGSGIVRTFGAKGGLTLYILFIVVCIVPSQMMERIFTSEEQILAFLPWLFGGIGVMCGVVGTILLLRANLKNG